jgi:hypothetical protein
MPLYSFWSGVNSRTLEIILVFELEPGWPRGWCFGFQVHRLCRQQRISPTRGWEASDPSPGQPTAITEPATTPTVSCPEAIGRGVVAGGVSGGANSCCQPEIGGGEGLASRSGQRLWPQPGVWVRLEAADRIEFACHSSGFGHRRRGLIPHFESARSFCLSFPVPQYFLHWPSPAIAIACALYFAVFALN